MPGIALAQTDAPPPESDRAATDRTRNVRPDRGIDIVKARLIAQIERRLDALDRMSEAVEGIEHVTEEHAKALRDNYKDAEQILETALKDIEKAEIFEELREIVSAAFEDTLVFALLVRKTHLVVGSDSIVAITGRLDGVAEYSKKCPPRSSRQGHVYRPDDSQRHERRHHRDRRDRRLGGK